MKPITIYKRIVRAVKKYNPDFDEALFEKAFFYLKDTCKRYKKNANEHIQIPMNTAFRLTYLKGDDEMLVSTLLCFVVRNFPEKMEEIDELFSAEVTNLVRGALKLDGLKMLSDMEQRQIDALRKLYLSICPDFRVILIKLAERVHLLETIERVNSEDERKRIANETLKVFVPIADGLGVWDFKWRLEDMSFKVVRPEMFHDLASEITDSKRKMESYIRKVSHQIEKILREEGIKDFKIAGRVKNLYSIYKKIVYKNKSLDEIYDIIAIRIIVNDQMECYRVLGIIHNLWRPLAHRIKDYIAIPKMNGYRSLHTTIFCIDNHLTEIQIRTFDMDEEAEYGAAAHFSYGEKKFSMAPSEEQKQWISNLKDIRNVDDPVDDEEYKESLKVSLFSDYIFVFTPKGHIKDMPKNATPIDFAYAVHTEMGHKIVGAKINGKMVSLDTPLNNGDIVEVITKSDFSGPKREWLSFVKTSKAKSKIKMFLRRNNKSDNAKVGRELLNTELAKLKKKLSATDKKKICEMLPYDDITGVYAAIGEGSVSTTLIIKKLYSNLNEGPIKKKEETSSFKGNNVKVEGIGRTNTRLAQCCDPKSGESIKAFITLGRGVSIHSEKCSFLKNADKDRILDAEWQ